MRRLSLLLILIAAGCGASKAKDPAEAAAKRADYKVSPQVAEAWQKRVNRLGEETGELYFVVAYRFASDEWCTVVRTDKGHYWVAAPMHDELPGTDDFCMNRPSGRWSGTATVDALAVAKQAAEYSQISYVAIVDARAPKLVAAHILKDKALASATLPADVDTKLKAYLYYLQHAAAGYSRDSMP